MARQTLPKTYCYPYPRMLVTVDAIIIRKGTDISPRLLLIERGNNPYRGRYALPGGFPEMNELLVDAAKRELWEETGLSGIELKQLAAFDAPDRDPRDRNISIVFYGFTDGTNDKIRPGDDAAKADWFPLDNLPLLAFDHKHIIETFRQEVMPYD